MVEDRSDDTTAADGAAGGREPGTAGHGAVDDGRIVVAVEGELDAQNSDELRRRLDHAFDRSPAGVVVDLRRMDFIDSVGLSVLVGAHNRGVADGIAFEVRNASPSCMRVLEITRLVDILDLR